MTVQMIRGREITRPTPEALNSTILDHATVVDASEGFGLRNNSGLWPSYNCLDMMVPTVACPSPLLSETGDYKTFDVAPWIPAFEFAVYGGVQCSLVGLDRDDQFAEARRVFERSEARGVEIALREIFFPGQTDAPGSDEPLSPTFSMWDETADITPSGQVNLTTALSILVGHAAANYAGQPTLHLPRAAVLAASGAGLIVERDGKFYTKTGAKVAAGGGYDDPDDLASGQWTLYATGEVYVERSAKVEEQAVTMPGDGSGTGSDENGLGHNISIALIERMFRVGVDCYSASITASVF